MESAPARAVGGKRAELGRKPDPAPPVNVQSAILFIYFNTINASACALTLSGAVPKFAASGRAPTEVRSSGGGNRESLMREPDRRSSLDDLGARLEAAREEQAEERGGRREGKVDSRGWGVGLRLSFELVIGIALGVGLGLLLDRWFETRPLFLILFFFLGAAAGILNVYRAATGQGYAVGFRGRQPGGRAGKPGDPAQRDDDATGQQG